MAKEQNEKTPEAGKPAAIGKGTKVHLVLADGKHGDATVTAARKGDLVDLEAEIAGQTVTITSSPLDETGKQPDSWHLPETAAN